MNKITNTEILLFICGYQGGTIHQLAEYLRLAQASCHDAYVMSMLDRYDTVNFILDADYDKMQDLMRLAQRYRNLFHPNLPTL